MRTLHLDSGKEMRGGQWQALSLLQGLGAESILLTAAEGPLMKAALERGIDARPLTMFAISSLSRRVDLTHAHDARSHSWAAALGSCPLVVSRRVAFPIKRSLLSRWKYRRPERYLAISEHVKQMLLDAEISEDRISVVYDGVDIPECTAEGDKIVALATDDPMKGRDLLEEAAKLAGVDVRYSTDLVADLPTAAVFVYTSRSEGLGSAALLAMAYGVPVVASRVGGLPEVVMEGQTGVLTENDPPAIAAAIRQALANRHVLAPMARRCVEERFSSRHMVDKTLSVYRQVLA